MAQLYKALGRHRDLPQLEAVNLASSAANTNFEHVLCALPNLAQTVPANSGLASALPENNMRIRAIYLVAETALTGANTNTVTLNIRQWRAGAALGTNIASVAFTSGTNLAAFTPYFVSPAAANNIQPGDVITVQTVNAGTGLGTPVMQVLIDWETLPS